MASAPTDGISTQRPEVLILVGASLLGGVSTGEINFGTIAVIFATSDKYSVGQSVCYSTEGQRLVNISRYQYATIPEGNILYTETAV
jgi:hypothetical protein